MKECGAIKRVAALAVVFLVAFIGGCRFSRADDSSSVFSGEIISESLPLTPPSFEGGVEDGGVEDGGEIFEESEEDEEIPELLGVEDRASGGYFGRQLSEKERYIYNSLLDSIKHRPQEISLEIKGFTIENGDFKTAVYAIYYDHPELFYFSATSAAMEKTADKSYRIYNFYTDGWEEIENKQERIDRFNRKIDEIVSLADGYGTDFEKAVFTHDYIIDRAVYDHETYLMPNSEWDKANNAYACLIEEKTMCVGFSGAYKLILNRLGIECVTVSGYVVGEAHAWNAVKLQGKWYIIDLTYDNCSGNDIYPEKANKFKIYRYFGLTDAEYGGKATWNLSGITFPVCDGKKYDYYNYLGYYIENYSFFAVRDIIEQQADKTVVTLKFKNKEDYETAKRELFNEKRVLSFPSIAKYERIRLLNFDEEHIINIYKY